MKSGKQKRLTRSATKVNKVNKPDHVLTKRRASECLSKKDVKPSPFKKTKFASEIT